MWYTALTVNADNIIYQSYRRQRRVGGHVATARLFCVVAIFLCLVSVAQAQEDLSAQWRSPTGDVEVVGEASYYDLGLMDQVAATRGYDLDGYVAGVALMPAGDLGRDVWLSLAGSRWVGPFLVVDCSQLVHYEMNLERGRVVEVGAAVWGRFDLPDMPVPVRVRFARPRTAQRGCRTRCPR